MMSTKWVTTGLDFPGCEVEENLGLVRGVIVRSRNVIMDFFGQVQELFGGNITIYAAMCEKAREDATKIMMHQAGALGANAVIGVRYESSNVNRATEIVCYGTAVRIVAAAENGAGGGRRR